MFASPICTLLRTYSRRQNTVHGSQALLGPPRGKDSATRNTVFEGGRVGAASSAVEAMQRQHDELARRLEGLHKCRCEFQELARCL